MEQTSSWQFQPKRLVAGVACFAYVWGWFQLAEAGKPHGLAPWLAYAWAGSMALAVLLGVFLVGNGLGLINTGVLASAGTGRAPRFRTFAAVYFGIIIGIPTIALVAASVVGSNWIRSLFVSFGALFVVAILGRPWWLYGTIRRTGWFALIQNERAMRLVLAVLGVSLASFGLLAPESALHP
jgi:hypothetical protein